MYKWKVNLDSPTHMATTIPVAIKVLRCSSNSGHEMRLPKRAAKELIAWVQLDHPNILPLLGFAVFNGSLSMVSPWMSNGDLRAYLLKNNISNLDRIDFCEQILGGLVYIHNKNMVHGDLKAMNVMVSHERIAMITDFGNSVLKDLARLIAPTNTFGMSKQFAPPEHLAAEDIPIATKQSDVYSYGMTVLEILTGETPFADKNDTWLVIQASRGKLLPSKPSTIDDDIWSMLLPCWAHNPLDRPAISDIHFPQPPGRTESPARLSSLGQYYSDRFQRLGDLDDLKWAIEYQSRALALASYGDPDLPLQHFRLANSRLLQYDLTGELSELENSLSSFRWACQSPTGAPRDKFMYASRWATYASQRPFLNPVEAYQTTMDLLPQFIWLGATTNQRYEDLNITHNLARQAASVAILSSQHELALEWLEYARFVVWNQSLMLRSPMDRLHSAYPDLATHLQMVAHQLQRASFETRAFQALSPSSISLGEAAQERRRLASQYTNLIAEVRQISGLEDFLQPMTASRLTHAARMGPIVVISCDIDHCDALIILPGQSSISYLSLPDFTMDDARQIHFELDKSLGRRHLNERGARALEDSESSHEIESVLATLWNHIVKPVLDFLGYTSKLSTNSLPHITWCPTGILSFLPLHAAGDYSQPGSRVFDYAMSSYTPTLTALLASTPSALKPSSRVLAIGQTVTPGHNPLSSSLKELAYIQAHTQDKAQYSYLIDGQATTAAVLDAMEQSDWVHLACHAHQNIDDPTRSGFFLHDGTLDLASINRRSFKNKGLAFLSAGQTAQGDGKLFDEAMHLASGMLMTGYQSVIATMWSVFDSDAPFVADKVYAELMRNGTIGNGEAGKALHNAVAALREEIGENKFERWVPYVHFGS